MLSLAMPVVVAEVGWVAMQIVDISMVGRLGPEAIGAVGVGSALFLALAVVGIGLLLGLDPLVAQAFGARDVGECGAWLRHGLVLAVGLTVPLTVVAWMAATFVSVWGFEPRVLDLTQGYLRVVTWSLLPLLLFTVFRRYVQALVMVTLVSANIINAAATCGRSSRSDRCAVLRVGRAWSRCCLHGGRRTRVSHGATTDSQDLHV